MITHNTAAPTIIAVLRARSGVDANWRLNHAREPNGSHIVGSTGFEPREKQLAADRACAYCAQLGWTVDNRNG